MPTTNSNRFLIIVGVGLLGMLLAYLFFPSSIYFVEWQDFPSPPAGTVELSTLKQGSNYELVGRTATGETYTYEFYSGWFRRDVSPSDISEHTLEPCTYAPPEFGPFNNVPHDIISCATATSLAPDASIRLIYALDRDGHIWRWEMGGGFKEPFACNTTLCRRAVRAIRRLFAHHVESASEGKARYSLMDGHGLDHPFKDNQARLLCR